MGNILYRVSDYIYRYRLLFRTLNISFSALALLFGTAVFIGFLAVQQDNIYTRITKLETKASGNKEIARVGDIIDGDTIKLVDGRIVRYIGIDSPEEKECFYRSATKINEVLVEGKNIVLEKDISETDNYGRLLRYVWLGGVLVNEKLVREGFAKSTPIPPDLKYNARIYAAQRQAREENRGLWGVCR